MSDSSSLLVEFEQNLRSNSKVVYRNTSGSELIIRCPYCGDSKNDLTHAHLYISTTSPFAFYCQRCNTKGFLNNGSLRDMEVDDQDLINRIGKTSKKTLRDTGRYVSDTDNPFLEKKRFKRPPISLGKKHYRDKIEYLVDRMGVDLTMQDLEDLKIVTSLNSFMKLNEMEHLKEYYEQSNGLASLRTFLEKYSLGFLSMDTNYMGFRHTQDHHSGRRYYTESMNRPFDIGSKIYTIGGELDLLSPTLNLVLTEGVMDITSVWLNLYDKEKSKDTVFCSANGKSFLLVVKMLRRLGFLSMNLDMYSDNDVDLDYYKFILDYDNFNSIRIHYNTFKKEKDFGVSKDKIKEKVFKLK